MEGAAAAGQEGAMTANEKVTLFHTLRDQAAVEPRRAAHSAQHYGPQLRNLLGMGFGGARLERAIDLLGRYGGRLTRVVNALSEEHAAAAAAAAAAAESAGGGSGGSGGAAAVAAPPRAAAAASATEAATAAAVTKSRQQEAVRAAFQLAFAQLVSTGVPPKEAAAQALIKAGQTASAEAAAAPAAPAPPTAVLAPAAAAVAAVPPPAAGAAQWQDELGQLEGMGFGDEQRNVELLNRYNGRMLRVINALAEGPGS